MINIRKILIDKFGDYTEAKITLKEKSGNGCITFKTTLKEPGIEVLNLGS